MDNIVLMTFFSISIPFLLSLTLFEKKARITILYMIVGMLVALIVSQINSLLLEVFADDNNFVVTTITPVTEEIIKALPIIYYAFVFEPKKDLMLNISFAVGLGFAIFENLIMLSNSYTPTLLWVIARGFGAGLMHSICTVMIGICTLVIKQSKKLFYCGIFSMITLAIIYHSVYNCLVLSDYMYIGLVLPIVTYIPIIIIQIKERRKKQNET